jgi:SAM-dependent methyltransferase
MREDIPLAHASVDAVVASSAWHWMDPKSAVPEVARVLRPGGVLGLVWNGLDREAPLIAELRGLTSHPSLEEQPGRSRRPEEVRLPEGAPFGRPEIHAIRWKWRTTREGVIGLMRTYSSVIVAPEQERAEVETSVRRFVDSMPVEGGAAVDLPMACRCWKAMRT